MVAAADGLRTEFERRGIPFVREEHITPNGDYSVELLMRVAELDYLTKREREALIAPQGHTSSITKNTISARSIADTCVIPSRRPRPSHD